jgi:hypothetical protein
MNYYYTYYTYEEFGRGYIGSRQSKVPPEEDTRYMGSYRDKTFKPTQKIILQTYNTRKEALADEVKLHEFYQVHKNPHFANKVRLGSPDFYMSIEERKALSRRVGLQQVQQKKGIHDPSYTTEQRKINGRKGSDCIPKELKIKYGKISGELVVKQKKGIHDPSKWTKEDRINHAKNISSKAGQKCRDLKVGVHSLTKSQLSVNGKKGGSNTMSQRWQCTETNFVSTPPGLTRYQRNRSIDTTKRIRLS